MGFPAEDAARRWESAWREHKPHDPKRDRGFAHWRMLEVGDETRREVLDRETARLIAEINPPANGFTCSGPGRRATPAPSLFRMPSTPRQARGSLGRPVQPMHGRTRSRRGPAARCSAPSPTLPTGLYSAARARAHDPALPAWNGRKISPPFVSSAPRIIREVGFAEAHRDLGGTPRP